ncbi:hypothetical protein CAEBREN_13311 [Caenorhabditis brenneri]|uniref:Uncharacterized protein n=1 Tax=Caenorhabditis brenneri TaxID=135651 RepID=G0NUC8_CAEBE|nr:hypothetical protein CAEBREN_13311 [Caenorhabditis brenneri]
MPLGKQSVMLSIPEEVTRVVDGVPVVQNSCRPKYGLAEAGRQIVVLQTKMRNRKLLHKGKAKKAERDFPRNKQMVDERMKQLEENEDDEANANEGSSNNEGE